MAEHPNTERANTHGTNTGEPKLAAFASWAVLFASFGLSAATWIALARLAGFTEVLHLPLFGLTFALAWLMPIAIDGYVVVALVLWTAPVPERVAVFARKNTYAAASVGVAAQSAFHSLMVLSATHSGWRAVMAAIVGALPPAVAALAVHMRALIRRESGLLNRAAINVRRVIVPSGLAITEPNTAPIIVPNGHAVAEQISAPNGHANTRTDAAANTPNTPEPIAPNIAEANTEQGAVRPNGEQPNSDAANVRPISSARQTPNGKPNGDTAKNLRAIKRRYPNWRTNMPSVRECAAVIGVAVSTGKGYRDRLIAEQAAGQSGDGDDDKEREQVAVS